MNSTSSKILVGIRPEKDTIPVKTFTVNDIEGKLKPSIIHCFIANMLLDITNPPATVRASNGQVYIAVYDNLVLPKDENITHIKVIISFQQHTDGNFAIIRNLAISHVKSSKENTNV